MSYIGNSPGVASQRVETAFTATSNQTAFTPSSGYTLGYCDVYQNGVKLVNGDDYTASDGATVTLATGAATGDSIVIVASFPRGLSDGYLKSEADAKYVALTGAQTVAGVKTFSSQIVGIAGTAGAPAVTTTGDTDTGIFFPAANTLAFSTNGTEDARFDASGNLLVGYTSPYGVSGGGTNRGTFAFDQAGRTQIAISNQTNNAAAGAALVLGSYGADWIIENGSTLKSSNALSFLYGTSEKARIDSSGNLLVGTTTASGLLSLVNAQSTAANNTTTGSIFSAISPTSGIFMRNRGNSAGIGGSAYSTQLFTDSGAGNFEIYNTAASYSLVFGTAATERARIDSSGRFGIGTTSPAYPLDVYTNNSTDALRLMRNNAPGTGAGPNVDFSVTQTNSQTARLASVGAQFSSGWGGNLLFYTKAADSNPGTTLVERGRFSAAGDFQLYITPAKDGQIQWTDNAGGSVRALIYANGNPELIAQCGGSGGVKLTSGATSWVSASDIRSKDIIEHITDAVSKVTTLSSIIFSFKDDEQQTRRVGLVAQELLEVLPEAVYVPTKEEELLGVRYAEVVPLLVAAIKEQQAIIEQLQADVATLKGTP